jgi:hypothetical protein
MAIWFWLALALNVVVWSIFFVLLARGRWNWTALTVGVLHMLFAVVVSVAPFRSFLDAGYPGLGLGLLRFEKMAATLPATLIFCWAIAAAWVAVSKGRGRWLLLLIVGDIFMAVNFGGSTLLEGRADNWRIEFGEGKSITGFAGAFVLLLFFTMPFLASAIWAAKRRHSSGPMPPLAIDQQEKHGKAGANSHEINGSRFSEHGV